MGFGPSIVMGGKIGNNLASEIIIVVLLGGVVMLGGVITRKNLTRCFIKVARNLILI